MNDTLPDAQPRRSRLSWLFTGDDGLRAGWSLLLFFILLTVLSLGVYEVVVRLNPHALAPGERLTPGSAIMQEAMSLAVVVVAALIMSLIERRRFVRYNLGSRTPISDLLKGLGWGFVMLSVLVGLLALTGGITFSGVALTGGAIARYAAEWAVAFALVGLFEEFAFRGYLQFTLARGIAGIARVIRPQSRWAATIGFWGAAILLSIVLFAAVHLGNNGESVMGIVSVSLAGLLLVFSLWWTGSLWWAIGFHAAWDWAQSYVYGVADSGLSAQGHLLVSHPAGPALLSGGTTGPEGSVLVIPVMIAAILTVVWTMPRRPAPLLDGEA